MHSLMPAVLISAAGIFLPAAAAGQVSDAEALAISHKHCVMCHAARPAHPAFAEPPKDVALETVAQLKQYAHSIYEQTMQNRAMPIGNQSRMSEAEREALGRWLKALP